MDLEERRESLREWDRIPNDYSQTPDKEEEEERGEDVKL